MKKEALKISLFTIIISTLIIFVFSNNVFFSWRMSFLDKLFLSRPPNQDILIIEIDSSSINKLGRWPWDRKIHAEIISKICNQQPAVLGVDINFSEPSDPWSDQKLVESFKNCPAVVLPLLAETNLTFGEIRLDSYISPIIGLRGISSQGVANIILDRDGILRKSLINLLGPEGVEYYSFAKVVAEEFNKKKLPNILLDQQGKMVINFSGPPGSFNSISAQEFLSGDKEVSMNGKIVLIGATAPDLHDNYMVPTSGGQPMSGVEIHANAISTIIENSFLRPVNNFWQIVIFVLLILGTCLFMFRLNLIKGTIFVFVLFLLYLLSALVLFEQGYILDILYSIVSIMLTYLTVVIFRNLTDVREKRKIKKAFSRYVSPEIIEEILIDPKKLKLGGENRELSILFSDIRGFTSISEKLSAHDLVSFLNDYLSLMSDLIMEAGGVVDKYIGDAIMAFWGAPIRQDLHAENVCRTAISMVKKLNQNISRWNEEYGFVPDIGIGINSGEVIVGNIGSDKRFDYTVMGDAVNLSSRLESLTKKYKVKIIVSQFTKEAAGDSFVFRYLDKVVVKGKKIGVEIFELIGLSKEVEEEEKKMIDKFSEAIKFYRAQNWEQTIELFEKIKREDGLVEMYLERIQEFKKNPPAKDWDGSHILTEK